MVSAAREDMFVDDGSANEMATEQTKKSDNALLDPGPAVYEFGAIETLNEFYEENGWAADYRQIEAGILRSQVAARQIGRVGLFREIISHKITGSVRSPDDFFSIILSMSENAFCMNGHQIDTNGLLIVPPNSDLDISTTAGTDALTIQISEKMLSNYQRAVGDDDSLVEAERASLFRIEQNWIEHLRRMVVDASRPIRLNGLETIEAVLAADLGRLLIRVDENNKVGDPYRRLTKYRILTRAKDYIHEHLTEVIRVTDLCAHCGVSLSTLERMFRRELDTGPKEYIQVMRLHEVRRNLLNGNPEDLTIGDIAMQCGFTHLGRFSQHYRTHFGCLPSEERHIATNSN